MDNIDEEYDRPVEHLHDCAKKAEKEGTQEFVQPKRDVQALIDEKVLKEFLDTVQKSEDGYYVRLPWREITTTLPDNRAIALRRLDSVWNSLQKDKELLNKYNDTLKEQERHDD
ncbi:hypothetical protein NECAME_11374 [Necator americanus]|uniref:Uncharacterized protein n=1 Tax=Necator americanus TaxID=51031 RepID=W2T5I1_NECAM|nr:hypothetical protein NECAME_11374 [Necator americanus]ETN76854.1 hypothetical protein NECAME_11374 [Necator americanus]